MTLTQRLASLLRRRRPLSPEDAAEISGWVNEGGTFDPDGPPRVIDDSEQGDPPAGEGHHG